MAEATPATRSLIVGETLPFAVDLMRHMFGNYVVQNMFQNLVNQPKERHLLCQCVLGSVSGLSVTAQGCRVLQFALTHLWDNIDLRCDIGVELVAFLRQGSVNQFATHVYQKWIPYLRQDCKLVGFVLYISYSTVISAYFIRTS